MAATRLKEHFEDPIEVELLAVFRGMQLCNPTHVRHFIIETDCLLVVQAIHEGANSYADYTNPVHEILLLKQFLRAMIVTYINRLGNKVAYSLDRPLGTLIVQKFVKDLSLTSFYLLCG